MQVCHEKYRAIFFEQRAFDVKVFDGKDIGLDLPGIQKNSKSAYREEKKGFPSRIECHDYVFFPRFPYSANFRIYGDRIFRYQIRPCLFILAFDG
jgi:hypothetical protein